MESKVGAGVNNAMSKGRIEEGRRKAEKGVVTMPNGRNDWIGGEVRTRKACGRVTVTKTIPSNIS